MRIKTNFSTKLFICILTTIFLFMGCSENSINENLSQTEIIKNQFLNQNRETNLFEEFNISWDEFFLKTDSINSFSSYEFKTSNKKINDSTSKLSSINFNFKIIAYKNFSSNLWNFKIVKLISRDYIINTNILEPIDFTGTALFFNLNNELLEIQGFVNGQKIDITTSKSKSKTSIYNRPGGINLESNGGGGGSEEKPLYNDDVGFLLLTPIYHYTDWYKVYPNGTREYTYTAYNGVTYEYIYVPNNTYYNTFYNNNNNQSIPYNQNTSYYPKSDDDRIDDSKLTNPCAKIIFSGLKTEMIKKDLLKKFMVTPNGIKLTFAEEILKLFNDSNTFDLTIENGSLTNSNGSTSGTKIIIDNSYLKKATQLSIARTMIHEMVHAFLNVKYSQPIDAGFDFRQKMELYTQESGCDINDVERFHHEFMGQYVNAIAISLYNWDSKYGTGGNLGWDYYKFMAFGGLYFEENGITQETYSFQVLIPKQTDRDKIKNILKNEQDGNSNSKGEKCD